MRLVASPVPRWTGHRASPVVHRWNALTATADAAGYPFGHPQRYPAHAQLPIRSVSGAPLSALGDGWACVARTLADGRRQIQHLLVPGDLFLLDRAAMPSSHLVAITPVTVIHGGPLDREGWMRPAVQRSLVALHQQLLDHAVRLGRQHANERVAHLFLELRDRLLLAGIGEERRFEMPLTQELLGDVLGLTSVHVNRTLQAMRREGLIVLGGRVVELPDPAALARLADYRGGERL